MARKTNKALGAVNSFWNFFHFGEINFTNVLMKYGRLIERDPDVTSFKGNLLLIPFSNRE